MGKVNGWMLLKEKRKMKRSICICVTATPSESLLGKVQNEIEDLHEGWTVTQVICDYGEDTALIIYQIEDVDD